MRYVQSVVVALLFSFNLCFGQCLPGVDKSGFCMTCKSRVTRCDTIVPIGHGTYIAKVNEEWYHVRDDSMYHVLTVSPSKYPQSVYAEQFSHYFNLRIGSSDHWYDMDSGYKEMPFSEMYVSDMGKSMIGRIASKWSILTPRGETHEIRCDSLNDAVWPYADVVLDNERMIVNYQDERVLLKNVLDARFVGVESVLYRTTQDLELHQWQLVHLPTERRMTLRYDTIDVEGDHMLGTVSKRTVLLDSLGNVLFRSGEGQIILRYNHNRIAIWRNRGEVAFVDYAGRQINTKPLDSVEPASYGIHLCSEPHDSSICVLDDNGAVIVPSGRYYAVKVFHSHLSFSVLSRYHD